MATKSKAGTLKKTTSGSTTSSYSDANLKNEVTPVAGDTTYNGLMNDGSASANNKNKTESATRSSIKEFDPNNLSGNYLQSIYHSNNIYDNIEVRDRLYKETFRFGLRAPSQSISTAREYLFFTKPDLNIYAQDDTTAMVTASGSSKCLLSELQGLTFWEELANHRQATIGALENSYYYGGIIDPFNHLLQNMVTSNLDVPALTAETIDTPTNMYGVGYSYRGSSEASDDNQTFSLEFKDTRYLDVYYFFKAYEEYETLKHHGIVRPSMFYTVNKILHDQFSIYKFIVDEDLETIIYYGKYYGVMPLTIPREVFSNPTFDNGITYSVDFKAAFYEDMRPDILSDFNKLSAYRYRQAKYKLLPYNNVLDKADMRTAKAAYIIKCKNSNSPTGYVFKLRWKGDRTV